MKLEPFCYETTHSSDFDDTTRYYKLVIPIDFVIKDGFEHKLKNKAELDRMRRLMNKINKLLS